MLQALKGEFARKVVLIVIGMFASTLLWAVFLQGSALTWQEVLEFSLDSLMDKMLSLEFILFILFFPLSLAFACFAALKLPTRGAVMGVLFGYVPAIAVSYFLFPVVASYWLLLLVIPLGFVGLTLTTTTKTAEIKKFTQFRSFWSGIGTFALVLALGSFAFGVIEIMPEQDAYLEKLEGALSESMSGEGLQQKLVEKNLEMQYQLLFNIYDSQPYKQMSDVEEPRVQAFNQYYLGVVSMLSNAKEDPEQYMRDMNLGAQVQALDTHELLMQSVPGYSIFSEYYYILYPLSIAMVVASVGNLVFRAIGASLALLMARLMKNI